MLKIALTGNLGSGKSTARRFFEEAGFYTFDADAIIKGFYEERGEVYEEVIRTFGKTILDDRENIDRKRLADLVFEDERSLRFLENITHRALYRKLEEEFRKLEKERPVVVEASLLIEKGTYRQYHVTLLVYAPYELCKKRALSFGYTPEDFERRWRRQMPPEEKLKYASFVIDNRGALEELRKRVMELAKVFKNWMEFQDENLL